MKIVLERWRPGELRWFRFLLNSIKIEAPTITGLRWIMRRGRDVLKRQSDFARPAAVAVFAVDTAFHLHGPLQVFAVPALVVQRLTPVDQVNIQHRAERIHFQLDVVWYCRIRFEKNFDDFFEPQMLVAFLHRGPDVLIDDAEGEVNKPIVVENARFSLEFSARSVTVVHKRADGLRLCPRFLVELTVDIRSEE